MKNLRPNSIWLIVNLDDIFYERASLQLPDTLSDKQVREEIMKLAETIIETRNH